MADAEPVSSIAPAPTPVAEAPLAAPVAASAPAIEPAPAPLVTAEPAPIVEAPIAPVENAPVAEAPKVGEAPKVEDATAEKPPVEAKPAAPAYTDFKVPEGAKIDPAKISAYTNILGKYGITQDGGQELLDFHGNAVREVVEHVAQEQRDVFEKTRSHWVKDAKKEFGNRYDTVLSDAKWAIQQFGGNKAQIKELLSLYDFGGAGDHPAEIRAWANVAKKLKERQAPATPIGQRANEGPAWDKRYANKS